MRNPGRRAAGAVPKWGDKDSDRRPPRQTPRPHHTPPAPNPRQRKKKTRRSGPTGGLAIQAVGCIDRSSVEPRLKMQALRTVRMRHWITSFARGPAEPSPTCTKPAARRLPPGRRPGLNTRPCRGRPVVASPLSPGLPGFSRLLATSRPRDIRIIVRFASASTKDAPDLTQNRAQGEPNADSSALRSEKSVSPSPSASPPDPDPNDESSRLRSVKPTCAS